MARHNGPMNDTHMRALRSRTELRQREARIALQGQRREAQHKAYNEYLDALAGAATRHTTA